MTVDKLSIFDGEKKSGQRELPRVELTKELLDSVRHIEGFPIGTDEDIIRLSDPPYYTACPNPFIGEFIKKYGKPYDPETDTYHREPFAADVSEGKNDPIYNAHSYHTKVPYKAIMRYILHYTEPGDIVFDGFCGTGMTGVAAQLCGDRKTVESLGYQVKGHSITVPADSQRRQDGRSILIGARRAILSDLAPSAAFIAHNYNSPAGATEFERMAQRVLSETQKECGWMYASIKPESQHKATALAERLKKASSPLDVKGIVEDNTREFGSINYIVWSDVFLCPNCSHEIVFFNVALDRFTGRVREEFSCLSCQAVHTKRGLERAWVTIHDTYLDQPVKHAKQVPVLINMTSNGERVEKAPDAFDIELISFISRLTCTEWLPTSKMPEGYNTEQPKVSHGLTHVHHFFSTRSRITLSCAYAKARPLGPYMIYFVQQAVMGMAKIARYAPTHYSQVNQYLSGTLYVASQVVEVSLDYILANKAGRLASMLKTTRFLPGNTIVSTNSTTNCPIPTNSVDYIFTDPPFGSNLMYSELNYLWESWLRVTTNNGPEAIENSSQGKSSEDYRSLMEQCFYEYYRVLKPGRWLTVEFHNSHKKIWNLIQESILKAGFVIANVATLDKKQGTFKQVTTAGAVKQDLVISAYKPSLAMERTFSLEAGTEAGVWHFVREHLSNAPKPTFSGLTVQPTSERQNFLLFDRMVAFHIQRGATIPMSASQFYAGLKQRFIERDGMYFLQEQAVEYEQARAQVQRIEQLSIFVTDEKSAIIWVRGEIESQPQTYGELMPKFMKNGQPQRHEKMPDLLQILEQNFLKDNEGRWYVPDVNRQVDLEKLRERDLLREFEEYRNTKGKLKVFRTEAVRAGFKQAWAARDFATIVSVAKKIPEAVLQEDSALLMYYDNARTRLED